MRCPVEGAEFGVGQRVGQLACAVSPEVAVDDGVAVSHAAVDFLDGGWPDELVVLAPRICRGDGVLSRCRALPCSVDDGVVAGGRAFPALVAIHRVVATADRRDPGVRVGHRKPPLEIADVAQRGPGWRVPPVEQGVNADRWDVLARGQLDERQEMAIVRVYAARPDEADQVQATRLARSIAGCPQGRTFEERAVLDRGVDPGQVLEHGAAGAQVQMPDLRVAHLSGRQANRLPGRREHGVRPSSEQPTPRRHVRGHNGIDRGVPADPEAVEYDEDDGPRPRDLLASFRGGHLDAASRNAPPPRLARAVTPALPTMPAISSGLSEAPPTSAPSM